MARKSAKQIGALWRHEHEKVGIFLTGILDLGGLGEVPIAIFRNDRKKKGTTQPDYRIVLSKRTATDGANDEFEPDPLADHDDGEPEAEPEDQEAEPQGPKAEAKAQTESAKDELPY